MGHPERSEDVSRGVDVERFPRDPLDQFAEHDVIDVAVDEAGTGRRLWRHNSGQLIGCLFPFLRRFQIEVRRETGIVSQQLPNADIVLPVLRKVRNVLGDGIIQPDLAEFH